MTRTDGWQTKADLHEYCFDFLAEVIGRIKPDHREDKFCNDNYYQKKAFALENDKISTYKYDKQARRGYAGKIFKRTIYIVAFL